MAPVGSRCKNVYDAYQMREFQKQSEIMNMSEETMDEALIDVFDGEGDEEAEADGVVSQVLAEIGLDLDGKLADAPTNAPPQAAPAVGETAPADEEPVDDLMSRLQAL